MGMRQRGGTDWGCIVFFIFLACVGFAPSCARDIGRNFEEGRQEGRAVRSVKQ